MKKNYFLKTALSILAFSFFLTTAFSQGDCSDLTTPIQAQMGLDVEPADFFVTAGAQNGRIFRDGVATVCPNKPYPGDFNPANPYNWTAIRLYNSDVANICITINVDVDSGGLPCSVNGHGQVYQSVDGLDTDPYDPANQATNFVGDVGSSATQPFSVEVVPGWFQVVFTNTTTPDNCDFSFTIDDGGTGVILCDETAGISDNSLNAFEMFPNPASEYVNFKFPNSIEITSVSIYDVSGKLINEITIGLVSNFEMNIGKLSPGIYFTKVSSGNISATKKLIIK